MPPNPSIEGMPKRLRLVFIMKRREKTVPTEVAQMIEALRLQSSAKELKPSLP
jgi:hypothetical protein